MDENTTPTVDMSLAALSDAVGKASEDFRAVRASLDVARADIVSRNTSLSREVVAHVEKVIVHLRETDESLRDVLKDHSRRDSRPRQPSPPAAAPPFRCAGAAPP
jgi:hypothetical protein